MGSLIFQGDPPFDLFLVRPAKAEAEGDTVILTLPVAAAGPDQPVHEIRVLARFGHAHALATKLREAAVEARRQAREGG